MTHHTRWRGIALAIGYSSAWCRSVMSLGRRWCATGTPNFNRAGFVSDVLEILRNDKDWTGHV